MAAFAVTAASLPLGSRVVTGLGGEGAVTRLPPDGAASLDGATCLISLASGPGPSPAAGSAATRLAGLRRALAAADAAGTTRVVHLSSAVVYGASADNDVPLTEDAPVRPDLAYGWSVELAEAERLVGQWRDAGPGRSVAVLRPALVVAPDDDVLLARRLSGLSGPRAAGASRPVQFVHVDDVAAAVILCATAPTPVDGAFNVAPDGWVGDEEAAALAGSLLPPPTVPARLVQPARRLLWALHIGATPPEAEAYATHPWVVAPDRLRSLGWTCTHSTEEALVATTSCSTLASIPPGRRQELLLGATTAILAATAAATLALLIRALGRRRQ
jgi:nucleoside-diphosphate-sugar epimerase